ncbi:SDR family oxidoreductase [Sulfitobacter donghicola]|uniref:Dehydrogenase n=1 Tax=Sulfitobacter donghicola DSW-25 = KCTC 12864 = JCM 14565 TaxID=1300350 RepID=A0A073IM58_9RHOB|nr:SDR family NAD(P)-dependent oxidoreductase [Sulfitobacter donghicola]KEJ90665.1 dehydrogenase [Sulfitobacter donghicola DSW-25 = KCTC 12864 = JCM 14565]KIN67916.1 Oxidoreductase, short chain dehydrogenase/reductase family [Sulfitobacter donghicola DSW-25 = KCTC 12864 = JCM 14565]
MDISGKTVVVTGGASGIGAALARQAVEAGAKVCIADRNLELGQKVAAEIGGMAVSCDVTQETQIIAAIDAAEAAYGPVDVFVSNAGLGKGDPTHAASASDADWMLNWNVHVMSHVWAARALLPAMIERGSGHFVNVASAAGLLNQIGDAAYSATKHAAVSFAESLLISHGDDGIGVSVVCPQYVATPLLGLGDADAEGNLLTAGDVAKSVWKGVSDGTFVIMPHPDVAKYYALRGADTPRWIKGMQLLRAKAMQEHGGIDVSSFYKLI